MSTSNTITFLHAADIHLGAKFAGLGEKSQQQRAQLRQTFNAAMSLAIQHEVDMVLLAGDTFDSNKPSPESLECFRRSVHDLAAHHIPVVIIGGTHDCLNHESVLRKLAQEMTDDMILLDQNRPWWRHPGKDLCVYGVSQLQADQPSHPGRMLAAMEKQAGRWHIGMVHAALELQHHHGQEAVVTKADIEQSGMNYLALGHWHNKMEVSRGNTIGWYPGSPEMVALDEKEQGQVLLVALETAGQIQVAPIVVGKRLKKTITLDWNSQSMAGQLQVVTAEADPDVVLELILNGQVDPEQAPEERLLMEKLGPLFFHVTIKNKTHPRLGDDELARFHERTVIGTFVRQIQQDMAQASPDKRPLLEEALQLGIQLMTGKDVAPWS